MSKRTQQGNNVDFTFNERGDLVITLNADGRAVEAYWRERAAEKGDFTAFSEMIEDFTCNGWEFFWSADELGHMSDVPVLSENVWREGDTGYPFPLDSTPYAHPADSYIEARWPLGPGYIEQLYNPDYGKLVWTKMERVTGPEAPIVEACLFLFARLDEAREEHQTVTAEQERAWFDQAVRDTGCDPTELDKELADYHQVNP